MDVKTAITVFSGMGGTALGIKKAGLKELLFIEKEENACDLLEANFPDVPIYKTDNKSKVGDDVTNISGNDILKKIGLNVGELFLYQSSAPCQDFSILNRKNVGVTEKTDKKDLFLESIKHIEILKPHAYVFENVDGIKHDKAVFPHLLEELNELDYYSSVISMNSIRYGSAQSRPRTFFIGYRKDLVDKKKGSLEEELLEYRSKNGGRLPKDNYYNRRPSKPPETTPLKEQQQKIVDIIPDALLYFSFFGGGVRKNPITSSMPTIVGQPTFMIMRKGMMPGDAAEDYNCSAYIKPNYPEAQNNFNRKAKLYEQAFDELNEDEYKLFDELRDNEIDTSGWTGDYGEISSNKENIDFVKKMIGLDIIAMDEYITYNFHHLGRVEARYLPTLKELLLFSDFPVDWNTCGKTYEVMWSKLGDIVMPKIMEAITRHIIDELS